MPRLNKFIWLLILLLPFSPGEASGANPGPEKKVQTRILTATGNFDPFRPFLERDALLLRERGRQTAVPRSPLLQRPLRTFRLVGIGGDDRERTAVVEDENRRFYLVKKGSHLGSENARVTMIARDHIIVERRITAGTGVEKTEEMKLSFHQEEQREMP
jgi:Tfp pilus assembly protein PilP